MIVGVTGGYCSGKSIACALFQESGFAHIDVDRIGHDVLEEKKDEVAQVFGDGILKNGKVDRRILGEFVFADPEKMKRLEAILHPHMAERVREIAGKKTMAVINAALLVEMRLYVLCDYVIGIQVDEAVALLRGMKRDGLAKEDVMRRIASQRPLKEKLQYVDKVIENNGTMDRFQTRVRRTIEALTQKRDERWKRIKRRRKSSIR